jgi:hypothetical protein
MPPATARPNDSPNDPEARASGLGALLDALGLLLGAHPTTRG